MLVEPGKIFNRRADIQAYYGSDLVKGISASTPTGVIVVIADPNNTKNGYHDRFIRDDRLRYYGQKAELDQNGKWDAWKNNNGMLSSHKADKHDVVVFEKVGSQYACRGNWECESNKIITATIEGKRRPQVVFQLRLCVGQPPEINFDDVKEIMASSESELRAAAYNAGKTDPGQRPSARLFYQRSATIVAYALKRSGGKCERCTEKAPFFRENNTPFLEVHHMFRLSDGGPDMPDHVAAICPNCHRELHFGKDGEKSNKALMNVVAERERQLAKELGQEQQP